MPKLFPKPSCKSLSDEGYCSLTSSSTLVNLAAHSCYLGHVFPWSPCYAALRLLAITRLKFAGLLHKPGTYFAPWNRSIVVNITHDTCLSEAATLRFVADNTSIPVPRLIIAFVYKNLVYSVMCRTEGEPLLSAWKDLSDDKRMCVLLQLRSFYSNIRRHVKDGWNVLWVGQVLTYGDLAARNIFVRGEKVVEVMNWDIAGPPTEKESLVQAEIDKFCA